MANARLSHWLQQRLAQGLDRLLRGLLCGVLEGFKRHSDDCTAKVIAAETVGASSFGQAWEKGEIVTLDGIDSIATVRFYLNLFLLLF